MIYEDQAEVLNLCQYDEDGQLTGIKMVAQWKTVEKAPTTGDTFPVISVLVFMVASVVMLIMITIKKYRDESSDII